MWYIGIPLGFLAIIFGYKSYFGKSKDSFGLAGFILGFVSVIYLIHFIMTLLALAT